MTQRLYYKYYTNTVNSRVRLRESDSETRKKREAIFYKNIMLPLCDCEYHTHTVYQYKIFKKSLFWGDMAILEN